MGRLGGTGFESAGGETRRLKPIPFFLGFVLGEKDSESNRGRAAEPPTKRVLITRKISPTPDHTYRNKGDKGATGGAASAYASPTIKVSTFLKKSITLPPSRCRQGENRKKTWGGAIRRFGEGRRPLTLEIPRRAAKPPRYGAAATSRSI